MIAEIYGKDRFKGKGGSMHLIDLSVNLWHLQLWVIAYLGVGLALSSKIKKNDKFIFFGDGAIEEGVYNRLILR